MVQNGALRGRSLRQMEKHLLPLPSAPLLAPRRSRDIIFAGGGGGGEKRRCGGGGGGSRAGGCLSATGSYRLLSRTGPRAAEPTNRYAG